jgi:outer membrane immunogenic protein
MSRWFGGAIAASLLLTAAPCAFAQPDASDAWSGPYAGAGIGGDWGHAKWTALSTSDLPGTVVDASSPRTYTPRGVRGSVFAGYDWRRGAWVFGPEAEFGLANAQRVTAGFPGCTIECAGAPGPGIDITSAGLRWDASVRGRVGYLVLPQVLVYATGGAAWQDVRVFGLCQASLEDPECLVAPGDPIMSEAHAFTASGGTVGGGVEWRLGRAWLAKPWTVRLEYRRVMLGAKREAFFVGQPSVEPGASTYRFRVEPDVDVVSAALVAHF